MIELIALLDKFMKERNLAPDCELFCAIRRVQEVARRYESAGIK